MSAVLATTAAPLRSRAWGKFRRNHAALLGLGIVLFFVLLALLAPLLATADPLQTRFTAIRKGPSAAFWLGTDELGRDIFSRMAYGARASLTAGLVSVCIALIAGLPFGLVAGYFGGWIDSLVSRATEALLAIPFLILAIALAAFLGPSLMNAMIAIGVSAAPKFVRLTRGQVLAVKSEDYVHSARALGASDARIIARHLLPNVMPPLIVQATITIATAIIAEASLSFLGLGLQPPDPSWGSMLNTAKNFMIQAPWMSIFPGSAIFLVVLGFNLLGDGLRDALDPRQDR
ncbi:ABC transporter permease [Verminephrobacter aporrectodeae subsp. tuberculatae]|uniref:ABC transporter permease n=1 Tax=Verminephrobacter aporrectodeae TaxID=1110389 RepID=UPI0022371494|nr:ABC transporter permease [Verminephrobacter aporrectodeae]MCW5255972.1 ABC transporter permease [Verminephrobacter aporrectodeae subsp. tuberculatae]